MRPRELWTTYALVLLATLFVVGCAATSARESRESTGTYIDDALITTKVKSSFVADPTVSALDIGVETTRGVVHLTGVVDKPAERQRAIQLAQGVSGVKHVNAENLFVKH